MQSRSVLSLGHSLFANPNIVNAWNNRSNEWSVLQRWFNRNLGRVLLPQGRDQIVRVVDYGCGDGNTSMLLLDKLRYRGQQHVYTGVDPVRRLLNRFRDQLQSHGALGDYVALEKSRLEDFRQTGFHLAFVCNTLPYVDDLHAALTHIVNSAQRLIIVHSGSRGLMAARQQFQHALGAGACLTKTSHDVMAALGHIDLGGRNLHHQRLTTCVDMGDALHDTQAGQDLMSYILQRPFGTIPDHTASVLRDWLTNLRVQENLIVHDVGIITIS
jgi:SAM-dependent methyltransferase